MLVDTDRPERKDRFCVIHSCGHENFWPKTREDEKDSLKANVCVKCQEWETPPEEQKERG
jgi:hypothetical protein